MKNKKTLFIVAGVAVLGFIATYFYKKSKEQKANVTPIIPESAAKSQKAIQDAIKKFGNLSNIPSINDKDLALAISNNDLNLALNS
jgi:hypothetical protein